MLSEELLNEANWSIDNEVVNEDYIRMLNIQNGSYSPITPDPVPYDPPIPSDDSQSSVSGGGNNNTAAKAIIFSIIGTILLIVLIAIIYNFS
ncbi:MAG: hypothetical protein MJ133_03315 [Lachnospiraceae bacterium]|nr:hypothetical protein [Lachnospiraceae bacterium]